MDARRNTLHPTVALMALDAAEDLGVGRPESLAAARRWIEEHAARAIEVTPLLRRSGLTASQLRAVARLGKATAVDAPEEPIGEDILAEREPSRASAAEEAADPTSPTARPAAGRGLPESLVAALLWLPAAAVLLLYLFFGIAPMSGKGDAANAPVIIPDAGRWDATPIEPPAPTKASMPSPRPRMLLPTDDEVIQAVKEDLGCLLPEGAPERWKAMPTGPLQLTVWENGDVTLLEGETRAPHGPYPMPGPRGRVRAVVRTPWGRGVLLLVSDTGLDGSSRIFWLDPYVPRFELVYDSGDRRLIQAALMRIGEKDWAYNDLTRVFFDAEGVVHFSTEDKHMYRTRIEGGEVVELEAVREVEPSADIEVASRSAEGRRFFVVLYR